MQKKLLPQVLLIIAVLAISVAVLVFRYESNTETRSVKGVTKEIHKFPLNSDWTFRAA